MGVRPMLSGLVVCGLSISAVDFVGCARHADFIQARNQLSAVTRTQEQDRQRMDAVMRRLEAIEKIKDPEATKPRVDDLSARFQKMENRLTKLEETAGRSAAKVDPPAESRAVKPVKSAPPSESVAIVTGITPTSAFNLAYNDYLNGNYDLSVAGFQRFVKDFPGTSLTPNAQYWMGESYYNLKDYGRAIQIFDSLVAEYPGNEKVPAALYKLGLATAETGDLAKSRKNLKRVIEEFPSSEESKLAKYKLAEIR
ncbi:MAG: tol-pal system protein YbgF [Nitrospira sp.]|nr:tol-pal system protein YbgF [Nitrospira sp.]